MALSVIGAGFGRTGTESLKQALEILGHGPCYHMYEVLPHPERVAMWRRAMDGSLPDWDVAFAGYGATVDWPGAYFWRALSDRYPKARIILSVRDPEAWYRSMNRTILPLLRNSPDADMIGARLGKKVFNGRLDDKDHIIATFQAHIEAVQAAFSDDRLLTYEVGSGWTPLCDFLGCVVPDQPYPHSNNADDFAVKIGRVTDKPGG